MFNRAEGHCRGDYVSSMRGLSSRVQELPQTVLLCAQAIQKLSIPNFLIVAIDTRLRDYLVSKNVNVWYKNIQASAVGHFGVTEH